MTYRVYRNLNTGTWTVQHKTPRGWRKLESLNALLSPHVEFKIYEAGRDRVRKEGHKNVHAYALVEEYTEMPSTGDYIRLLPSLHAITYSPFNDDGFTCDAGSNLDSAVQCTFTPDGVILARTVGVRH